MDLGKPLVEYGPVEIGTLRDKMQQMTDEFWTVDRAGRVKLAGDRPGNAVFLYNDAPAFLKRAPEQELKTDGRISVLRYPSRDLFGEVQEIIDGVIRPHFEDCDPIRVQLAELPPGQNITPHRDMGILALIHRTHIPLVTHRGVNFFIGQKMFHLAEGNLYDLNNAVVHSVENRSDVMRVHLMVDMMPRKVGSVRYFDTESDILAALGQMQ